MSIPQLSRRDDFGYSKSALKLNTFSKPNDRIYEQILALIPCAKHRDLLLFGSGSQKRIVELANFSVGVNSVLKRSGLELVIISCIENQDIRVSDQAVPF